MVDGEKITSFTKLETWQYAHKLRIEVLLIIKTFPTEYAYGLSSQMQRAAISVASNIAEGFGRSSVKEKLQFYNISRGSLIELQDQLLAARDIHILSPTKFNELADLSITFHKLLNGLMRSLRKLPTTNYHLLTTKLER